MPSFSCADIEDDLGEEEEEILDDEDLEYEDDDEEYEEDENVDGDEYEDEFAMEGEEFIGGPEMGSDIYNQNILDGIQAKSFSSRPSKRSRRRRKRRPRDSVADGRRREAHEMDEEEMEYDEDYDNEGNRFFCFSL